MSWRRFCVLLSGLSGESRYAAALGDHARNKPLSDAQFNSIMSGFAKGA